MVKKKTEDEAKLTELVGDKPRPTSDNPVVDAFIEHAVKYVRGEDFAYKQEAASQAKITEAGIKHQEMYGSQPEAPAPYFAPNVVSDEVPEHVAIEYLIGARTQLEHVGHFETNQAIVSIDAALEWLKKCEGQRT